MRHSSLASLGRHTTAIAASIATLITFNASAQTTNRYYPVDKSHLEILCSHNGGESYYPFIIVDESDNMAARLKSDSPSNYLEPVAITLQDGYVESDDESIKLTLFNVSSKTGGLEFQMLSNSNTKHLGTISDMFYLNGENANAKETFTFIFDDIDDLKLQIRSASYKNGLFFSIVYTGHGNKEGFKLMTDDTKELSIYQLDNLCMSFSKEANNDIDNEIVLTLNPNPQFGKSKTLIKYIINNGEEVSISDLLASEHSTQISWSGFKTGSPWSVSLPNYNPGANTLWAVPTIIDASNPIPISNVFTATLADNDISTAISAPNVDPSCPDEPLYYNLHGIRVAQPSTPGIYVCRQGNSTTKVLVK